METNEKVNCKIVYHFDDMPELVKKGDWIDLAACDIQFPNGNNEEVINRNNWIINTGDFFVVNLGISLEMPKGYEAIIAPRSSLFKKHGIILVNSIGVIDNDYNGNQDIWKAQFFCINGPTKINKFERIVQFRLFKNQPEIVFNRFSSLTNENRGGFGSTG